MRIDALGTFWHEGERVEHPRLQRALAQWLDVHPHDGRYILSNGYDWSYVQVDDVPFFVRTVRAAAGERQGVEATPEWAGIWLELSDSSGELLRPRTLSQNHDGALYCRVKSGRFEAKFTPAAQLALEPWLVEVDGGVGLRIGGRTYCSSPRGA